MDPVVAVGVGMMILGVGISIGIAVRARIARREIAEARAADAARQVAALEAAFDDGAIAMHRLLTPRPYRGAFPAVPLTAARAYRGTPPQLFDQDATETETPDA